MKKLFTLILFFSKILLFSQNGSIIVYLTPEAVQNPIKDTLFATNIRHAALKPVIIVTKNDSTKVEFEFNKIWGYKDVDGRIYRNFGINFIYMEEVGNGLILYSDGYGRSAYINNGHTAKQVSSKGENFFFSKSIDSKVYNFEKFSLKEQYKDKPCFPEMLAKMKPTMQSYSQFASILTARKLMEFYNKCK